MGVYTPMGTGKKVHNYKKRFFGAEKFNYNSISGAIVRMHISYALNIFRSINKVSCDGVGTRVLFLQYPSRVLLRQVQKHSNGENSHIN